MSQYLSEAFKKLDILNEDTFTISGNGLEDFVKFEDEDEFEDSIDVIDPEAETIDDLQDSYVGKVILDCCVCHSKIYKDVEDVIIEDDIANANEECPFCYTTDGYKVIGQVANFDEDEAEENEIEDTEEEKKLEEGIFGFGKKKPDYYSKEEIAKRKAAREAELKKKIADREEQEREHAARVVQDYARTEKQKRDAKAEYERDRYKNIKGSNVSNTGKAGVHYSGGDYYTESKSINETYQSYDIMLEDDDCEIDLRTGELKVSTDIFDNFVQDSVIKIKFVEEPDVTYEYKMISADDEYITMEQLDRFNDELDPDSYNESKSIKEDINNLSLDTDDTHMEMSSDENGKVTVTTEPKTDAIESEEVITPLEPETQSEISDNVEDGGEIEIDMDEFDEDSFDELGEGYLKKVYENVNSFKTSNVSFIKNKLIVEGVIKFNSGKSKKTNFIFESREATKSGKVRFIGENKEIARGRKSFTVTGKVDNKKFMSESFNYNYGVRGANGKAQRLYGTIKRGK